MCAAPRRSQRARKPRGERAGGPELLGVQVPLGCARGAAGEPSCWQKQRPAQTGTLRTMSRGALTVPVMRCRDPPLPCTHRVQGERREHRLFFSTSDSRVRASAKQRRRGFKCRLEPGELYSCKGAPRRHGPANGGVRRLTLAEISEPESTCVSAIV